MISPEDYMLPCLNKKLFGIECFGCGLQRSTLLLFQGEFIAAFKMYPAIYTLILFALFLVLNLFYKFKYAEKIKLILVVLNVVIIVTSYFIKINQ
ncbi:MAG: DUF2752 domain-containing protein [Bacteroidetes bacterium]|nr:MAG: DUF2752 domain-containing protein [Bacteroidota bacterium]